MNVNGTSATTATTPTQTTAESLNQSGLGQDAFLKLLVTQLQHQDPTRPQDDMQFIGQLAQFASLEQLTVIAQGMNKLTSALEPAATASAEGSA